VAISYEMVNETRVIPLDGRKHLGKPFRFYMVIGGSPEGQLQVVTLDRGLSSPLTGGSFKLTVDGGTLEGVYTGQASVSSSGRATSSLDLQVTGGTYAFAGATGSLTGDGSGSFVGEGNFSFTLRGSVSTSADPLGFRVRGTVSGSSTLSCATPSVLVTLQGDGSFQKLGTIQAVMTHLVGNAGCSA
jgi:hypothetical protein